MPFNTTYTGRFDSGSANNPALNLLGDPAIEFTFEASGPNGDLILDGGGTGTPDPDTVVSIGGVSYSFTFELAGTMPTTNKNGANQVPEQFQGSDVYLITVIDYPLAGDSARLAFMPNETATLADMDAFGNGAIDIQNLNTNPPPSAICFLEGSLIDTPDGPRPIESLKAGDLVQTLDHGAMPIVWISSSHHLWPGSDQRAQPICIEQGALGPDQPLRDLVVSPQHGIVLGGRDIVAKFDADEVLVPAKALTGLPGVRTLSECRTATYYHLLLQEHAIITAHGTRTESFYPGPIAMKMMTAAQRQGILALIPDLADGSEAAYGSKARPCLTVRQGRELIASRIATDSALKEAGLKAAS